MCVLFSQLYYEGLEDKSSPPIVSESFMVPTMAFGTQKAFGQGNIQSV